MLALVDVVDLYREEGIREPAILQAANSNESMKACTIGQ